jgi:hypothetical protein
MLASSIESAAVTSMHFRFINLCEIHQPALHFFNGDAGDPASALVSLNARLGTVQQLFASQPGDDD